MTTATDPRNEALAAAVRRYRRARDTADAALEDGRAAAVAAIDAGLASERSVAEAFGIDRNRVRAWRGKVRVRS